MNVTWSCWAFSLEDFLEEGDQTLREDALPQAVALGRGKSTKWSQVTLCHFSSSHSQRDQTREGSLVHILFQPITGTQIRTQNRSSYHGLRSEPTIRTQIKRQGFLDSEANFHPITLCTHLLTTSRLSWLIAPSFLTRESPEVSHLISIGI